MRHALAAICLALVLACAPKARAENSGPITPPTNYTGNVWVMITVPADVQTACFQVVWGPWIGSGCNTRNADGKFELKFQKTKTDQVPFTVYYPDGSVLNKVAFQYTDPCPSTVNGCKVVPLTWRAR